MYSTQVSSNELSLCQKGGMRATTVVKLLYLQTLQFSWRYSGAIFSCQHVKRKSKISPCWECALQGSSSHLWLMTNNLLALYGVMLLHCGITSVWYVQCIQWCLSCVHTTCRNHLKSLLTNHNHNSGVCTPWLVASLSKAESWHFWQLVGGTTISCYAYPSCLDNQLRSHCIRFTSGAAFESHQWTEWYPAMLQLCRLV